MTFDAWNDHHDALLQGLEIDIASGSVSIRLLSYPHPEASERVAVEIEFSEVTAVNVAADLTELAQNAFAGHVGQARIADGPGTSYFYLVEGYLAVTSKATARHRSAT
ncbi:hypothetical protein [Caulobacter sp. LARHSG274]